MRSRALLTFVALTGLLASCEEETTGPEQFIFRANLAGANERPAAVTSNGTGVFSGSITSANILNYTVTWSGLSSASNNAHIHGPITAGSNAAAGVLIDFNAPTSGRTITHGVSGSATGFIDLNVALNASISADSLRKLFDNGGLYVNVHTVNNPGGEIAGVITKQ